MVVRVSPEVLGHARQVARGTQQGWEMNQRRRSPWHTSVVHRRRGLFRLHIAGLAVSVLLVRVGDRIFRTYCVVTSSTGLAPITGRA